MTPSLQPRERVFLTTVISILVAPKLAAFGLPPEDRDYAIAGLVGVLPMLYHYGVLYLRAFLKARHVPLPEDLDQNPTQPANPATSTEK